MNPYIGDRPLDPPEDDECETCCGLGQIEYEIGDCPETFDIGLMNCPDCQPDNDPGEPNEEPDL